MARSFSGAAERRALAEMFDASRRLDSVFSLR
jgi:hypothetical protein